MKLDRLISILVILLRKERVQSKVLAEMFGVSVRTILRDVDAINLAGIPIVTYQGMNGGIGIVEGYRLDRSVLTGDEMATIITTLKGMAETMPDNRHEVLVEKFKNILPPAQLEILNSKLNQLIIDPSPWGENKHFKQKIAMIRKGIESFKELEFAYTDSIGQKTTRRVEPYSRVLKGQQWYLYAWCLFRKDFRLFKLSRMEKLIVSDTTYKPREISVEELPWKSKWKESENRISLELVFEKELESIVEEWFREDVVKDEDGRILVKASFPENNWLYGFLLSFGTGVEVVNPSHIRKILAEKSMQIYRKYSIET
ncbi:helix-turn-helix transcriptional regulator [Marinisporobacter balticus]|uniref:Putative DNA-binding transcriptional regulator YafY n=1 Tax=Marinisporobacter balticus TaxID=2018667 RepID=A0A4R2KWY7_9FIRM|nr:YafY family protein [Marinisporobacter balticus]TCO77377.1 putative DNA-binding transcriptional regulator YafY [Marinisporobacter balticus]